MSDEENEAVILLFVAPVDGKRGCADSRHRAARPEVRRLETLVRRAGPNERRGEDASLHPSEALKTT